MSSVIVALSDKRKVKIAPLSHETPVSTLVEYINALVDEDSFLLIDKRYSLAEEKEWKFRQLQEAEHGQSITLVALHGKRIVGSAMARRDRMKEYGNVSFGIAIAKDFRGVGLGELLLKRTIDIAKKEMKPKNMYISYADGNIPAANLYRKLGFRKIIGRFPNWIRYRGRYIDRIVLLYSK